MESQLDPFERYLEAIEDKVRRETLPEKIGKLPEDKMRETICSLASIAAIQEATKIIAEGEDDQKSQTQKPLHLQYPFINHLTSFQLGQVEETIRDKVKRFSIQLLPTIIEQLQNREFLQTCYREFGIKGEVDIDFTTPQQRNAAYLLVRLLEKIIWIQISQESLNVFGTSVMQDIEEEPEPIQELYRNILSSKQDFSGIDYLRRCHIPRLKQSYLQSLASQSSPKTPPETHEEKILQALEERMSPTVYKDWQVAAVITKIYEEARERIRQEIET